MTPFEVWKKFAHIQIRPDIAGMGAFGAALIARDRYKAAYNNVESKSYLHTQLQ